MRWNTILPVLLCLSLPACFVLAGQAAFHIPPTASQPYLEIPGKIKVPDLDVDGGLLLEIVDGQAVIQNLFSGTLSAISLKDPKPTTNISLPPDVLSIAVGPGGQVFALTRTEIREFSDFPRFRDSLAAWKPPTTGSSTFKLEMDRRRYRLKVGRSGLRFVHDRFSQNLLVLGADDVLLGNCPCPVDFLPASGSSFLATMEDPAEGLRLQEFPVVDPEGDESGDDPSAWNRTLGMGDQRTTLVAWQTAHEAVVVAIPRPFDARPENREVSGHQGSRIGDLEQTVRFRPASFPEDLFGAPKDLGKPMLVVVRVPRTGPVESLARFPCGGTGEGRVKIHDGIVYFLSVDMPRQDLIDKLLLFRTPIGSAH